MSRIDFAPGVALEISLLWPDDRRAVLQVTEKIVTDADPSPDSLRRSYVDVRLERELARIYYAADADALLVRHVDINYLSTH